MAHIARPAPNAMTTTILDAIALPGTIPTELRLFRDGWNDTTKGRFLLDADGAAEIQRRFATHGVELAMDFDHASFAEPGVKRDVPGYIGELAYRPGDGLYATKLRWTAVGLRAIAAGAAPDGTPTVPEYRYVSPAIDFDPESRRVLGIKPVALVSYPATHGQQPLVMSARPTPTKEPTPMKTVIALLGLAAESTEADVLSATTSLRQERDAMLGALGAKDLHGALGKIHAMAASRTQLDEVQAQLGAERTRADAAERAQLVAKGKHEGKLTPALEKLYADRPVAEFRAFLDAATPIPALVQREPQAQPSAGTAPAHVPGVPEKAFEELTAIEKDRLLRSNRVAFEKRLAEFEARTGEQPLYRAALARFTP